MIPALKKDPWMFVNSDFLSVHVLLVVPFAPIRALVLWLCHQLGHPADPCGTASPASASKEKDDFFASLFYVQGEGKLPRFL